MKIQIGSYKCKLFDDGKFIFVETKGFDAGAVYEFKSLGIEVEKLTSTILSGAELGYQGYEHESLIQCAEKGLLEAFNKISNESDLGDEVNQRALNNIGQSLLLIYDGDEVKLGMKLSDLYINTLADLARKRIENPPSESAKIAAMILLETIAEVQSQNLDLDVLTERTQDSGVRML
jgi:hypothetical protein